MPRLGRKGRIITVTALALVLLGGTLLSLNRDRPYDQSFDTRVATPAYRVNGPVVLFDEGHHNSFPADAQYKPFVDLVRSDGYVLRVAREPLSAHALAGVAVLAVVLPRGSNDTNDNPAFAPAETAAVERWVGDGGSLLLVTDHWPYGAAAATLAERFGVRMGAGMAEDETRHDPLRGASNILFSADNGGLRDHPVVRGRSAAERVRRVLTFTGQAILGPRDSTSFLALSNAATERPPTAPAVDRSGGDVRVTMEYGDPAPARGWAQGIALAHGNGRVVVLAEAGMLRATQGSEDQRLGMNVPGYDNKQLALNIMHWLSRLD